MVILSILYIHTCLDIDILNQICKKCQQYSVSSETVFSLSKTSVSIVYQLFGDSFFFRKLVYQLPYGPGARVVGHTEWREIGLGGARPRSIIDSVRPRSIMESAQYYGPAQRKSPIHAQFTTNNAFITLLAFLLEIAAIASFLVHLIGVGA